LSSSRSRLELRHPGGVTPILIGAGLLAEGAGELAGWMADRTVFVLSTPVVRKLHGTRIDAFVDAAGRRLDLEAPDGEVAKSILQADRLWQEMLQHGGKRDSRLVAFGGGSLTDLGGFVAGCFLRGIEVVHVPTTLLGMVDAAIGGKTAVDMPQGKNTVGLFLHPTALVCDTDVLTTLPRAELRAGLVEAVKKAAVLDPELFAEIERDLDLLLAGETSALARVAGRAAAAKCRIVELDPFEAGPRKVLNFGHTLGHALEGVLGYSGFRHGEAVAYGILFALRLAARRHLDVDLGRRLFALISRFNLPEMPLGVAHVDALIAFMRRDKKAEEKGLTWVLPTHLGAYELTSSIGWPEVETELKAFLAEPFAVPF
jgi:3-dehydroquinate synthase